QSDIELGAAKRVAVKALLERGADDIGAPASGHDFLTGGDESGAHRRRLFAAPATAIALFEVSYERFIFGGKRQDRSEWQLQFPTRSQAKVRVDLEAAIGNDLSGVEQRVRVKRIFDLAHDTKQTVADLVGHEFRSGDADPMFGGERAFELTDEA